MSVTGRSTEASERQKPLFAASVSCFVSAASL
jgi:hypothetical protein